MRLKLRKPYYTSQTEVLFAPVDFLRRLAVTIPPARSNLVRYHGIFAPNAAARSALTQLLPTAPARHSPDEPAEQDAPAGQVHADDTPPPSIDAFAVASPCYRRPWAELLKRVFDLKILVCRQCDHKMHRISHIDSPDAIAAICEHLEACPRTLPRPLPR